MNIQHIYGIFLRYWFNLCHSPERILEVFYWPMIDLFMWGLTGAFIKSQSDNVEVLVAILSGLFFWIVVWRAQQEIAINLLTEYWDNNLLNLFSSPLKLTEWLVAVAGFGIVKATFSLTFTGIAELIFYKINILDFSWHIIPMVIVLTMTGWAIGMLVASVFFLFGMKMQFLTWSAIHLIAPFSAVYYPLTTLPEWGQHVSSLVPTSYIFEMMRGLIYDQSFTITMYQTPLVMSVGYFLVALIVLNISFRIALVRGLSRSA